MRRVYLLFVFLFLSFHCNRNLTSPENNSYQWSISTPQEQGLSAESLNRAFDQVSQRHFMNAVVIIKNGFLVAERYYNGFDRNDPHVVRSVSKSFLSALVGIALNEGYIKSLDEKIMDYYPEYKNNIIDRRVFDITIRHLLTMKTGFDGDRETFFNIFYSDNWIRSTLSQNLIFSPGSKYKYSTAATHLLSGILTKATGQTTLEFANIKLFNPLKIKVHAWERDPQGYYCGGNNMYFTPRDMARFGYLYLNNGQLDGQYIVPLNWVQESLKSYYKFQQDSWGDLTNIEYGYLWWKGVLNGYSCYFALGFAGQYILMVPEHHIIIVFCSDSWSQDWDEGDEQERSVLDVIANYILPAIREK